MTDRIGKIIATGLAGMVAASALFITADAADARGSYCSRHRAECEARREREREASERYAAESAAFAARLQANLTPDDYKIVIDLQRDWAKQYVENDKINQMVSDLKREDEGQVSVIGAVLCSLFVGFVGLLSGLALGVKIHD